MHSDGNGGTHWHKAITNGNNYYADGDAIESDPCPGSNKNEGTAGATNGESNKSDNTKPQNNVTTTTSSNKNESSTTTSKKETTTQVIKSNDNSIKKITIDSNIVDIQDEMNYETSKRKVIVKIELNDSKANYEFNNKELVVGNNSFEIKVTAENNEIKIYKLNINRISVQGKATLKKFIIDSSEVEFKNNKATVEILAGEKELSYSYELSEYNASLKLFLNNEEVDKLNNVKVNDVIKIIVTDKEGNDNVYEITIVEASMLFSIIVYCLTGIVMLSPIVAIVVFIYIRKKKRNNIN